MPVGDRWERQFLAASLGQQVVLVIYFALTKWHVAVALSVMLLKARKPWYLWTAGFLFGVWAAFGVVVDIIHPVAWRSPMLPSIFIPYVFLYFASQMFYWWPLLKVHRVSWLIFAALYVLSTFLNVTSH